MTNMRHDRWQSVATGQAAVQSAVCACAPVIALHCSGATGGQWRRLADHLPPGTPVYAPDLIGSGHAGTWSGAHAFALADEAAPIVDLIDELGEHVHLVGHSYGGGVAIKVATLRPDAVRSVALYEPSAFHVLRHLGEAARGELSEIEALASAIGSGLLSGAYQAAASRFVDYWNGAGAWSAMKPAVREALLAWLPKAPLDFRALVEDGTGLETYSRVPAPVLLMVGERARAPSRKVAEALARCFPAATMEEIAGAGHMGPSTHTDVVHKRLSAHIVRHDASGRASGPRLEKAA